MRLRTLVAHRPLASCLSFSHPELWKPKQQKNMHEHANRNTTVPNTCFRKSLIVKTNLYKHQTRFKQVSFSSPELKLPRTFSFGCRSLVFFGLDLLEGLPLCYGWGVGCEILGCSPSKNPKSQHQVAQHQVQVSAHPPQPLAAMHPRQLVPLVDEVAPKIEKTCPGKRTKVCQRMESQVQGETTFVTNDFIINYLKPSEKYTIN